MGGWVWVDVWVGVGDREGMGDRIHDGENGIYFPSKKSDFGLALPAANKSGFISRTKPELLSISI